MITPCERERNNAEDLTFAAVRNPFQSIVDDNTSARPILLSGEQFCLKFMEKRGHAEARARPGIPRQC
jgi:hypothetical protein